jgi:CBS-domain-containing membrane protein
MKLVLQIALGIVLAPVVAIVLIVMLGSGLAVLGSVDGAMVLPVVALVGGVIAAGMLYDRWAKRRWPESFQPKQD